MSLELKQYFGGIGHRIERMQCKNIVKYVNLSMKGEFMVCCIKWALYDYTANKNAAIIVL